MQIIDTLGKLCPAPLILTKRAIKGAQIGSEFRVLCDNETAKNNLLTYISELGFTPLCNENNGVYEIDFKVDKVATTNVQPSQYCSSNGYAVVLKSKAMGSGEVELGEMLMKAFVNSLIDSDLLPVNVVIYNEGVFLALGGLDTAETLKKLSEKGVKVTVCGTCVDYYGVKEQLFVGEIGNMYKITEILSQSSHVIYP